MLWVYVVLSLLGVVLAIMWVMALIDILGGDFDGNDKVVWILVIIFLPLFGAILYFPMGKDLYGKTLLHRMLSSVSENPIPSFFKAFFIFSMCMSLGSIFVFVLTYLSADATLRVNGMFVLVSTVCAVVWTYVFYLLAKSHRPLLVYFMLIALAVMLVQFLMSSHYTEVARAMSAGEASGYLVMVHIPNRICCCASPLNMAVFNVLEPYGLFISKERYLHFLKKATPRLVFEKTGLNKKRLLRHAAVVKAAAQRRSQGWQVRNVVGSAPSSGRNGAIGWPLACMHATAGVCQFC